MIQTLVRKQKGFTLIELLVVIAIIGLLASIVLISLQSPQGKARDSRRMAEVRQIVTQLEAFNSDCGGYPIINSVATTATITLTASHKLYTGTTSGCGNRYDNSSGAGSISTTSTGTSLISSFPVAPTGGSCTAGYTYTSLDTAYASSTTSGVNYAIGFCTEAGNSTLTTAGNHYYKSGLGFQ